MKKQNKNLSARDLQALAASLADNPLEFIRICWPDMQIYDRQAEVLQSVVDNCDTFVHAANATGKSRVAALVAIHFFMTRTPARVIVTSSSETQLSAILWTEIQELIQSSPLKALLQVQSLHIRRRLKPHSHQTGPRDYILGHVPNQVESFQGHHLPNDRSRVLAIIDEASGVPDEIFEASGSWAHRRLIIGNPLSNTNFFFRSCKSGDVNDPAGGPGLLRKVIHIDGLDSPNIRAVELWEAKDRPGPRPLVIPGLLTSEEYQRRAEAWDEIQYTTRLRGHFHEGDQSMLFPGDWLNVAMDRQHWQQLQDTPRRAEAIGIDVAAGGRDRTCWTIIDRHGVIEQIVSDLADTTQIVGRTIELIRQHGISARQVAMDAGGGGKQLADRLRESGHHIHLIGFGESAQGPHTFKNRRAELYGTLREYLRPKEGRTAFALPPDAAQLRRELAVLPLQHDSEGRLMLPPKDGSANRPGEVTVRKLLKGSPDRADSLVLAVWIWHSRRHTADPREVVFWDPSFNEPLSPEAWATMPQEFQELLSMSTKTFQPRRTDRVWHIDHNGAERLPWYYQD